MATRTISNAGGSWTSTSTWVEGAVPTSTDDVVCTATSGNLSLPNSSTLDCLSMDLTSYTGTLSGGTASVLRFRGALTFGGTITAVCTLQLNTNSVTITSNGITWTGNFQFNTNAIDVTLSGDLTIDGTLTIGSNRFFGSNLYLQGNLTLNNNTGLSGTSTIFLSGSNNQTWSGNFLLRSNNLTIDKSGGVLTVSGSVQFGNKTLTYTSGSVTTTGSTLVLGATCTILTDGIIWNNVTTGSFTLTNSNQLTISGTFSYGNTLINGSQVNIQGNLTMTTNAQTGSALLVINGAGAQTWSGNFQIKNSLTINKSSGTLTISGSVNYNTGALTYTSGTVSTTGSLLNIAASATLNTNGINWNNITISTTGSTVVTLTSVLTVNGILTAGSSSQACAINGSSITLNGYLTSGSANASTISGTTVINLTGSTCGYLDSGTAGAPTASGIWVLPIVINTSGTCNFTGRINIGNGGSVTYTSGTVTFSNGAINNSLLNINVNASCTLNTNGMSWANININGGSVAVVTINSLLSCSGTMTVGSNSTVTFGGTAGFSVNTFSCTVAGRTVNFANGKTYTVTNSLILTGSEASRGTLSCGSTYANFVLNRSATQNVTNWNATNIDSSAGQTINTSSGTLTSTLNWAIASGNFLLMF
jgi:hypothetical protein